MESTEARPNRLVWATMTVLSIALAAYAIGFAVAGNEAFYDDRIPIVGLDVAATAIALHAVSGAVAIAIGPFQFLHRLRTQLPRIHRVLGRIGVVGMLATGITGLFVAGFAEGGLSGRIGFAVLGVLTTAAAALAWIRIRNGEVGGHRAWMTRGFALILAGVSLRLQLPALFWLFEGDATAVFAVVAWSCWIPNLLIAERMVGAIRGVPVAT